MPARSHSSARPDNRTAEVLGASPRAAHLYIRRSTPLSPQIALPLCPTVAAGLGAALTGAVVAPQMCVSCGRRSGLVRNTPLQSVVCGPCWFAAGGDVAAAEPSGRPSLPESVLPTTARDWVRALLASSWFSQRRRDSARRVRMLAAALARHADWEDHTSWPTWQRLLDATGWARSTMSSWLAELQRLGWLLRIEHGSTPQFRPMALQHVEGNRAAVYQLRVPSSAAPATAAGAAENGTTRTPTTPSNSLISRNHVVPSRARKIIPNFDPNVQVRAEKDGPAGPRLDEGRARFFDHRVPTGRAQMLAAAAELRAADRALRRLSPRWIRALMRAWWQRGWTNADVLHALSQAPATGGSRPSDCCPADQLRRPDGWVKHRLSRWCDASGPLPAPRQWEATQLAVQAVHGRAAAARLPYGAEQLRAEDVAASAAQRAEAAADLVRRWTREFHERREAPLVEPAAPETRARLRAELERDRRAARTQPRDPAPAPEPTPTPPSPAPSDGPDSAEVYQRALELARSEGRIPRPRRNHRRTRW